MAFFGKNLQLIAAIATFCEGICLNSLALYPKPVSGKSFWMAVEILGYFMDLFSSSAFMLAFILRLKVISHGSVSHPIIYVLLCIPVVLYAVIPVYGILLALELPGFSIAQYWLIYGYFSIIQASELFILHGLLIFFVKNFLFEVKDIAKHHQIPLWMKIGPCLTALAYFISSITILFQERPAPLPTDGFDFFLWSLDQWLFCIVSHAISELYKVNLRASDKTTENIA
jgi:hypothetical protein